MVYVVLAALVGWGLLALANGENATYAREFGAKQAFYVAEAGIENARAYLSQPGRDDWASAPKKLYTDKALTTLAGASYTVTLSERKTDSVKATSTGSFNGYTDKIEAELTRGY